MFVYIIDIIRRDFPLHHYLNYQHVDKLLYVDDIQRFGRVIDLLTALHNHALMCIKTNQM